MQSQITCAHQMNPAYVECFFPGACVIIHLNQSYFTISEIQRCDGSALC